MIWKVFKVLIGTQAAMLFFCFLAEVNNIEMTTLYMKGIINQSISSSCAYFVQETYKNDAQEFVGNDTSDLRFSDRDGGGTAVSGRFFDGNTQQDVYYNLYRTDDFKKFLDGQEYRFIGQSETVRTDKQGLKDRLDKLSKYYAERNGWNIKQKQLSSAYYDTGKYLAENSTTVINIGFTYLDKETLNNIIRWNMVANFYRGDGESLHKSSYTGEKAELYDYVTYNGFKIYYNTAEVDDITYTVYDLSTTKGMKEFEKVSFIGSGDFWDVDKGDLNQDFRYVCVATVTYKMRVGYDGVTYLKPLMKYVFSREARVIGNTDGKHLGDFSQYNIEMDKDNYGYMNMGNDLSYSEDGYDLAPLNNVVSFYVLQ